MDSPVTVYSFCPHSREFLGVDYAQKNQKGGGNIFPAFCVTYPPPPFKEGEEIPVLREDGRWEVVERTNNKKVTKEVIENAAKEINLEAMLLLSSTDWYVIRKLERGIDIPDRVSSYRKEVLRVAEEAKEELYRSEGKPLEYLHSLKLNWPEMKQ